MMEHSHLSIVTTLLGGDKMAERYIESRLTQMKPRSHSKVVAMARGLKGVVNLAGGDPDFDTPPHIIDTMVEAIKKGQTHYPPPYGLPALKQAIAKYHGKHGVDWGPSDVIVTAGSGVSLFLSTAGTLNINDEVILLEPYFMAYSNLVEYAGAKEIGVPLNEENSYRLDLEALKEKIQGMVGEKQVVIDIKEIKQSAMDAQLVAENIALQLEKRIPFRRNR